MKSNQLEVLTFHSRNHTKTNFSSTQGQGREQAVQERYKTLSSNFMPALTSRNTYVQYQNLNLTASEVATIENIKRRAALR